MTKTIVVQAIYNIGYTLLTASSPAHHRMVPFNSDRWRPVQQQEHFSLIPHKVRNMRIRAETQTDTGGTSLSC